MGRSSSAGSLTRGDELRIKDDGLTSGWPLVLVRQTPKQVAYLAATPVVFEAKTTPEPPETDNRSDF